MFLSHQNDLVNGQWKVLDQTASTRALVNDGGVYKLQHNICPHQGSRIRTGTGNGLTAICPYHAWAWNKDGAPLGSGTVGHSRGSVKCKNTHSLATTNVHNWSGFLFEHPVPLDFDISGDYKLVEYRTDLIQANYVPIMDLFLDIDHIPVVHPELYDKIDIPNVKEIDWEPWTGGSVQFVHGVNTKTKFGAIWLAIYPYTMFEWQPGAVFIMVNQPIDETKTLSHIFKYRDYNYTEEDWILNEQVWETAWQQDREQAERLEPGWRTNITHLDPEKIVYRDFLKASK